MAENINLDSNGIALKVAFINADYQGYDYTESNLGKVFLCGDAAGFAFYLSGEGIHQALVSGSETGKMILNKNYIPEQLNEIIDRKQHEIIGQRLNHEKGKWSRMSRFLHRLIKP